MVATSLLKKIAETIHTSGLSRVNNRDRVQAALGILTPEDLEETVDLLLEWEEFEDEDPDDLAEALAYHYSTLINAEDLTADDLLAGFDDGEVGSAAGWAKLAIQKGVLKSEAERFLILNSND